MRSGNPSWLPKKMVKMSKRDILAEIVTNSNNIVFFGGAGVSTKSGIPDFRSTDGLFAEKYKYPPETMLSHTFFMTNTEDFFEFYREKMVYRNARPNKAHFKLAELEQEGKLKAVITQNIDGLHQMAGSRNVLELHGSVHRNYCMKCRKEFSLDYVMDMQGIPRCDCMGIIKPDVVLYEESLDNVVLFKSINYIFNAEVLIVGGTSLNVYPAAGLVDYYRGDKLVLINKSETPMDYKANLVIHDSIDEVLGDI